MNPRQITPRLAAILCSLTESQLQMQASRSAALDATVTGVMGVDAAVAAIVVAVRSTHHLWIAALAALGVSAGLAVQALLVKGSGKIGPSAAGVLKARAVQADYELEQSVLVNLASDVFDNERALARREPKLIGAIALLVLAIMLELIGRVH